MTIGTDIAYAIDRASNQTQARLLTAYERSLSLPSIAQTTCVDNLTSGRCRQTV
jgi:hypothetical protein